MFQREDDKLAFEFVMIRRRVASRRFPGAVSVESVEYRGQRRSYDSDTGEFPRHFLHAANMEIPVSVSTVRERQGQGGQR